MTPSLLGSATCYVRDFVRTQLRTMLAIAAWEQARLGATRVGRVRRTAAIVSCNPRKSQAVTSSTRSKESERASLEGPLYFICDLRFEM